jgi:hypothetical protein
MFAIPPYSIAIYATDAGGNGWWRVGRPCMIGVSILGSSVVSVGEIPA